MSVAVVNGGSHFLDKYSQNVPLIVADKVTKAVRNSAKWSKSDCRRFEIVLSGFRKSDRLGEKLMWLCLTSARSGDSFVLRKHFHVWKKRLVRWIIKKYPKLHDFKLEYCMVRTSEGHGVLHILASMPYVPYKVLKAMWLDVHGAFEVWIGRCYDHSVKLARYLVSQYMAGQSGFVRMSYSNGWLFPKWSVLRELVYKFGKRKGLSWSWINRHWSFVLDECFKLIKMYRYRKDKFAKVYRLFGRIGELLPLELRNRLRLLRPKMSVYKLRSWKCPICLTLVSGERTRCPRCLELSIDQVLKAFRGEDESGMDSVSYEPLNYVQVRLVD